MTRRKKRVGERGRAVAALAEMGHGPECEFCGVEAKLVYLSHPSGGVVVFKGCDGCEISEAVVSGPTVGAVHATAEAVEQLGMSLREGSGQ